MESFPTRSFILCTCSVSVSRGTDFLLLTYLNSHSQSLSQLDRRHNFPVGILSNRINFMVLFFNFFFSYLQSLEFPRRGHFIDSLTYCQNIRRFLCEEWLTSSRRTCNGGIRSSKRERDSEWKALYLWNNRILFEGTKVCGWLIQSVVVDVDVVVFVSFKDKQVIWFEWVSLFRNCSVVVSLCTKGQFNARDWFSD